jgi:hypothetical protein
VLHSDVCGAWSWRPGSGEDAGYCERDAFARYWHYRPGGRTAITD